MKNWKGDLFFPILFSSQKNRFVPLFAQYDNFRPLLIFSTPLPHFSIICNPLRPFQKNYTFLHHVFYPFWSILTPFWSVLTHFSLSWACFTYFCLIWTFSAFFRDFYIIFNPCFGSKIAFFSIFYFFRLRNEKSGENSTCAKFSGENLVFYNRVSKTYNFGDTGKF